MKARLPAWSPSGCWVECEHSGRVWRFLVSPSVFDDSLSPDDALKQRQAAALAVKEALNRGAP